MTEDETLDYSKMMKLAALLGYALGRYDEIHGNDVTIEEAPEHVMTKIASQLMDSIGGGNSPNRPI